MKIGQVVQRYGIPVNTLYFYINNGLLVPPRRNSQYVFDPHTLEELEWLLELKELEFPLKTIHRLLSLRRISNFCSEEDREELRAIFQEQAEELKRREAHISTARRRVGRKLFELERQPAAGIRTGVPVSMLGLLCCPNCRGELMLEGASMSQTYVFQATLRCTCGYSAAIRDGILQTKNVNTSLYDKPDTARDMYRDLPSMTLSLYERSYHWLEEHIKRKVTHGKVWLEGYVNAWFFFHNHNFYHGDFYLNQLLPYLRRECELFGVYFFFKDGGASRRKLLADYPESSPNNFNIQWFFREIEQNFHVFETTDCGFSLNSGTNLGLGFHVPGEEMHLQPYYCLLYTSPSPRD